MAPDGTVPGHVPPRPPGVAEIVFAVLIGVSAVGTALLVHGVTWLIAQFLIIEGLAMPAYGWPAAGVVTALAAGTPALVLAVAARRREVRSAGRTWAFAAALGGLLTCVRAIPAVHNELYLLTLAAAAAAVTGVLRRLGRGPRTAPPPVDPGVRPEPGARDEAAPVLLQPGRSVRDTGYLSAAVGLAVLVPWLWVGALGGPLETLLALVAAAAVGALAAELLASATLDGPFAALGRGGRRAGGRLVIASLIGGVALALLATGVGGSGPHLAQIFVLPALALPGAALASRPAGRRHTGRPTRQRHTALVVLYALGALGPLAFVEPEETALILGLHDVGYWAAIGAACSLVIALVTGVIALVIAARGATRTRGTSPRWAAPATAVAMAATALVVYPAAGHPGFFGERLFVVMKQQADLTGLADIRDRDARLRATYRRLVDTAATTQAPLRATLRTWHLSFTPYYLVNGVEVDGGPIVRAWLSRRADVDRVLVNPTLRPVPDAVDTARGDAPAPTGPAWNIAMIGADQVWATGDRGQGIVIGGSDTGVDVTHPALRDAFRGGTDSWYDPWNGSPTPVDHNGHGTHTIGSALGAGGIGVAPGAQWMACVNLDRNLGNPAYYLDCLQFMLAPFPRAGDAFHGDPARAADVLTNSWGCPTLEGCDTAALRPAVDALTAAGIFFVTGAGNEGPRCRSITDAPAQYPNSFTVGAVDRGGRVAYFSSRGPVDGAVKPDIVAPGVGVVSALPGGAYGALDGTSMATPQVAGVVALMWSASPALRGNVALTAQILRATATRAAPDGPACGAAAQTGAGLVDALAAVAAARAVRP